MVGSLYETAAVYDGVHDNVLIGYAPTREFSKEIQAELFGIHESLRNRGVGVTSVGAIRPAIPT